MPFLLPRVVDIEAWWWWFCCRVIITINRVSGGALFFSGGVWWVGGIGWGAGRFFRCFAGFTLYEWRGKKEKGKVVMY